MGELLYRALALAGARAGMYTLASIITLSEWLRRWLESKNERQQQLLLELLTQLSSST